MVDNTWITDVQTSIFGRIKSIGTAKLKTKYPDINFTTLPVNPSDTTFPTVYVHVVDITPMTDGMERQYNTKDSYSIAVEVFANDSDRVDSDYIGNFFMNLMNTMGFQGVPLTEYNENYSRTVARYRKEIHADDVI